MAAIMALVLAGGFVMGVDRLLPLNFSDLLDGVVNGVDGQAGQQLNKALGVLPGQEGLDRRAAAARYQFLGDLGRQVAEGCPGWLFYREGLEAGHADAYAQRLVLMRHWSDRLRMSGLQMLVAVVPDKSRVESMQLCGLATSESKYQRFDAWQRALSAQGVAFADLRPALSKLPQSFYRTDVHMNPEGAETAAQAIAEVALPILGGLGSQRFISAREHSEQPRMGDLIVLAGLEKAPEGKRPEVERIVPERIEAVHEQGLLDQGPDAQVLLLGDSNGLRSAFVDRLGRALGREVWNQSQDGGFFSGAMLSAMPSQSRWPASLKLVVWQFSELALSQPLSLQEQRALDALR